VFPGVAQQPGDESLALDDAVDAELGA